MYDDIYDERTGLRKGEQPQPGDRVHYVDQKNGKASSCIEALVGDCKDMDLRTVTLTNVGGQGLAWWCHQDYMSTHPCSRPDDRHWEQEVDAEGRPVVQSRWHWPE